MLFQYVIHDIISILVFIIVLLQVIGFCGLIIFGILRIRNSGTINKAVIFPIVGVIEIIYLTINERIYFFILTLARVPTIPLLMVEDALTGIIPNIISLITFGVLFLFLGVRNKQNFGEYLMYSGIFWIVFGAISIGANIIAFLSYDPYLVPFPLYLLSLIMTPIASIFKVTSSIFFLIYAAKVDEKILLFSSISLLVASSVFAINSLLLLGTLFIT